MNNKPRSDSSLSQLPEEQQAQVYDWLNTLGYTETLKKLAQPPPEGLGLKSHRSCLHRFYKRYQQKHRTEDLAAAKENRSNPEDRSVLVSDAEQSYIYAAHQLATGPMNATDFSKVGRWLETCKDEEFKRLYARLAERNTAIAERKAALAEKRHAFEREKYELNVAQLALKHLGTLREIRADDGLNLQARIQAAHRAIFGIAPEEMSDYKPADSPPAQPPTVGTTSASAHLSNPINTGLQSGGLAASLSQTASAVSPTPPTNPLIHSSINPAPFPKPVAASGNSTANLSSAPIPPPSGNLQNKTTPDRTHSPSAPSTTSNVALTNPPIQKSIKPAPAASINPAVAFNSSLTASPARGAQSPIANQKSQIPPVPNFVEIKPPSVSDGSSPSAAELDLEHRVNDYTLARHAKVLAGQAGTKLFHCPCGHKELPCPEHGDFPNEFWSARPEDHWYFSQLRSKGLPYTSPKNIIEERERIKRKQAALARLKKEDPDGSKMRERARVYAIRRFRATDGSIYGGAVPDEHAWKTQCPCGAELPCDAHDGLATEVHQLHPLHSDYQKALAREGIPIFVQAQLVAQPKTG